MDPIGRQPRSEETRGEPEATTKRRRRSLILVVGACLISEILLTTSTSALGTADRAPALKKQRVESLTPIPDSAEIIFSAHWEGGKTKEGFPTSELYVSDVKGEHIVQITHTGKLYNHFAASPTRDKIAAVLYTGDTNKNGRIDFRDHKEIWILDLKERQEWPLVVRHSAGWGGVDWSPDGEFVYFAVRVKQEMDIYRVRTDGTGLRNITKNLNTSLGSKKRYKWVSDVSVSFDGEWIAFVYTTSRKEPTVIVICRIDGSGARNVTDGGGPTAKSAGGIWGAGDYDPEFSPDGQYISFQRTTNAALSAAKVSSQDVTVVKLDGTGLRRLSPKGNKGVQGISDWSKDNRIIFSEWNDYDRFTGPVLVNADGTNYHRITKLRGAERVRWIPPRTMSQSSHPPNDAPDRHG